MSIAFDNVSKSLRLRDPSDAASEVVAKKTVELAQRGLRDAESLAKRALQELNLGE
jgi:hypothetical protein